MPIWSSQISIVSCWNEVKAAPFLHCGDAQPRGGFSFLYPPFCSPHVEVGLTSDHVPDPSRPGDLFSFGFPSFSMTKQFPLILSRQGLFSLQNPASVFPVRLLALPFSKGYVLYILSFSVNWICKSFGFLSPCLNGSTQRCGFLSSPPPCTPILAYVVTQCYLYPRLLRLVSDTASYPLSLLHLTKDGSDEDLFLPQEYYLHHLQSTRNLSNISPTPASWTPLLRTFPVSPL